jgi:hypothetical protein
MARLDTTLSKEEIARYLASEITTNAPSLFIRDLKLKYLIFKIEDYHYKPSNISLRKKRHKYPSSLVYTYLCFRSSLERKRTERARALKKMNNLMVEAILLTGEGTYSNPFKIFSFYEAYYFVKSISNEAHIDGTTFLTKDGKLFAAFKYYNQTIDEIIILYFDISHLKEFTDLNNVLTEEN